MNTNTVTPARLLVDIGDTLYVMGQTTIVKSNRWMGNHKWLTATKQSVGFIRKEVAQRFLDEGKAKFYVN